MDKEEIREIYRENIDEKVFVHMSKYLDMTKEELSQISPVWAIGDRIDDLEISAYHPNAGRYRIAKVNLKTLLATILPNELDVTSLFNGDINDSRYATTLIRWEAGLAVDPPTISLSHNKFSLLTIGDGRHRTYLSNYLGEKFIPVAVPVDFYNEIGEIIELSFI